ncbi:family 2 glycosyl transferase [Streptococcus pneumoniae]|uniref:Family 2 glycosyl transferase n=3 Tax=Streptococcus pneumoniae TaxID=1313 RepID=A0A4J1Q9A0_STREE|nr:glycosyl transferase 2 family protein [Streptococcus pneumoniae GA13637]ONG43578.1 glycosyl transferase family 2 [Streptococcus pneumoniae]PDQ25753.1 glycosyltransferase family 2 protein [Streptococcus pneumoniae]CFB59097.1 family 2 glycosyl transferase [Streptococcus pneumoniae]CKL47054.1 family 2 glycosyl transferase [Streptococcus pneumoniae]
MSCPEISVIVPVYNVERYLRQCMDSLINQTYRDFEIILVNDGSTDSSGVLCEDWAKKDERIHVVHKKNEGLGFARNTGVEHAKGKYITFVDSDDYVSLDMLQTLYNAVQEYDVEVVYSAGYYRSFSNGEIKKTDVETKKPQLFEGGDVASKLLPDVISAPPEYPNDGKVGVSAWKVLYEANLFKEKGLLFHSEREFISEDAIFQIDCLKLATSALVIPDILYYYRENFGSLSMKYKEERFELDKILYNEQLKRVEGLPNQEILEERIERILIANIRLCIFQESLYKSSRIHKRLQRIRQICKDPISKSVLRHYPIHRLPFTKRLICVLAKYNMSLLLLVLTSLKYRNRSV